MRDRYTFFHAAGNLDSVKLYCEGMKRKRHFRLGNACNDQVGNCASKQGDAA